MANSQVVSTEIVERDVSVAQMDRFRQELATIESVGEAKEATSKARAIETYARAKKSKEMMNRAVELRIWAERRAGQLVISERIGYHTLAEEQGVSIVEASRWIHWAMVDENYLAGVLREIEESGSDLTLGRVLSRVVDATKRRVAPGLFALADGRYQFTWKANVHRTTRTTKATDDESAIAKLERLRRPDNTAGKPGTPDLRVAYSEIRKALQHCDQALSAVKPSARSHITDTITALHKAEDSVALARKENEVR